MGSTLWVSFAVGNFMKYSLENKSYSKLCWVYLGGELLGQDLDLTDSCLVFIFTEVYIRLRHALSFDKSFLVATDPVTCLLAVDSTCQQCGPQGKALSLLPRSQQSDCQGGRDHCKAFSQVYFEGKAGEQKECIFQGDQQVRKGTWKTKVRKWS